jgi:hypothetical protein
LFGKWSGTEVRSTARTYWSQRKTTVKNNANEIIGEINELILD